MKIKGLLIENPTLFPVVPSAFTPSGNMYSSPSDSTEILKGFWLVQTVLAPAMVAVGTAPRHSRDVPQ